MSTERLIAEAELTLKTVQENEAMVMGLMVILIILTVLWLGYMIRSWSWIPRKRQRRGFTERF